MTICKCRKSVAFDKGARGISAANANSIWRKNEEKGLFKSFRGVRFRNDSAVACGVKSKRRKFPRENRGDRLGRAGQVVREFHCQQQGRRHCRPLRRRRRLRGPLLPRRLGQEAHGEDRRASEVQGLPRNARQNGQGHRRRVRLHPRPFALPDMLVGDCQEEARLLRKAAYAHDMGIARAQQARGGGGRLHADGQPSAHQRRMAHNSRVVRERNNGGSRGRVRMDEPLVGLRVNAAGDAETRNSRLRFMAERCAPEAVQREGRAV